MSKIYKLKKWYSLNDAAKRLSITLDENINVDDILQMAVEENINLSWNIRHIPARKIAKYTKIVNMQNIEAHHSDFKIDSDRKLAIHDMFKFITGININYLNPNTNTISSVVSSYKYHSEIFYLDGIFQLALNECGALKDWIVSMINQTESDLISIDGYFVLDCDGWLWQMMDRFDREQLNEMDKDYRDKPLNHIDKFYPRDDYPEFEDLGIHKVDLEKFEKLLNSDNESINNDTAKKDINESQTKRKLNNVLKTLFYISEDKFNHKVGNEKITSNKLLTYSDVSKQTIENWLEEAAQLIKEEA